MQHPLGHVVALHAPPVQAPPTQLAPPHGGFMPQRQTPSLEQLSARVGLHVTHALEPVPHWVNDGVLHPPEQQPLGHVSALQTMATQLPVGVHSWPAGHGLFPLHSQFPATQLFERKSHARHAAPPMPHACCVETVHCPPWQQPLGHEAASHATHTPPLHFWFPLHAAAPPQPHVPAAEQVSPTAGSQLAHAAPPVPHAVADGVVQTLFTQQPLGHVAAVHAGATQLPLTHC